MAEGVPRTTDPEILAAAARLQRVRDERLPALPPSLSRRLSPAAAKRLIATRRDQTLKSFLAEPSRELRLRALAMAQAESALKAALSRDIAEQVVAVSHFRGVLTLAAPDAAVRFHLERQLRAGGERAILTMLRTPTTRIRVVVGASTTIVPSAPRQPPASIDAEDET